MQANIMITVKVAKDGDQYIKQQHLQAIANAADDETLEIMGTYAQKPGTLQKLKSLLKNPILKKFASNF